VLCMHMLPKKIDELNKSGTIHKNTDVLCFFNVEKYITEISVWDRFWARYLTVNASSDLHDDDLIKIDDGICQHDTKIDKINDDRILLGDAPSCRLNIATTKIYRKYNSCYLLVRLDKKYEYGVYIYQDNRHLLGLLDKINELFFDEFTLTMRLSAYKRQYTYTRIGA